MRWLTGCLCWCWATLALADMGGSALWLGADLDDDSGSGLRAGVDWQLAPRDLLTVGGGYTETDDDLSTRYGDVRYLHDFSALRLGLTGSWWQDDDVVSTGEAGILVGFGGAGWQFDLGLGRQRSDFEAIAFDFLLPIGPVEVPIAGVVDCELKGNQASGLLSFFGPVWSGYLGATGYDYDDTDCDVASAQLDGLAAAERRRVRDFGSRLVAVLSRTANAWTNRQTLFLDYELTGGIGRQVGALYLSLDAAAGEGVFDGEDFRVLSVGVSVPFGAANLLDVSAGTSRLDDDDTGFVSLLYTRLF